PTLPSIRRAARLIRRPASGAGRPLASLAPRPASWLALAAPLLFTAWLAPGAGAGPVELVSADERGVTLRLSVGRYDLGPPGQEGRRQIVIPRLYLLDVPGRPRLPYATALIALPPGANAVATVSGEGPEEVVEASGSRWESGPSCAPTPKGWTTCRRASRWSRFGTGHGRHPPLRWGTRSRF